MSEDAGNPYCQWIKQNILTQQYNKFCTLSYSFEETDLSVLTTSTGPGPFYLEHSLLRKDLRENQQGVDLWLILKVVDVKGSVPIPGLTVDLWNANAHGAYSGFSGYQDAPLRPGEIAMQTDQETFLRGRQYTDQNGMVEFLTIFPGWYRRRTPHLHIKILDESTEVLTTQLFFPEELNYYIHSLPPYNAKGFGPYTNRNDFVLTEAHGVQGGWPKFTPLGDRVYTGTLTIGVDRERRALPPHD